MKAVDEEEAKVEKRAGNIDHMHFNRRKG